MKLKNNAIAKNGAVNEESLEPDIIATDGK